MKFKFARRHPLFTALTVSLAIGLATSFCIVTASGQQPKKGPTTPPKAIGGSIHGHVVAQLRPDEKQIAKKLPRRVELPNAKVTARNVATGITSAAVTTNAHGYYQIPRLAPGTYQVCAGLQDFSPACLASNVMVTSFTAIARDDVRLLPKTPVIAGRVLLSDKSHTPCFTDRPAFRSFVVSKVTLENASGKTVAGPVQANGIGEYVMPAVQVPPGQYSIVAECQKAQGKASFSPGAVETFRDVLIPNSPPRVFRIETTLNNKPARVAPPGSTVTLHAVAQDPDGNPLRFKWVDSNGTSLGGPSASIQMQLPPKPSSTTVSVEANDGLGGFAYSLTPVTGAPPLTEALFTGTVVNAKTNVPIANAKVTVNGKAASTDGKGLFTVEVPTDVRYAVSVRKLGFALLSKATYSPAAELRLPLEPVLAVPFNVGQGGTVTPREKEKNNLPVTLTIPPNSLVDGDNKPASGNGFAFIWGYPPGTPIPGDMTADIKGKPRLETFGAVDIVLTDTAGKPLQVRSGASIGITMTPAVNNPPVTMPLLKFDEAKGIWVLHGNMALVGNQYKGSIKHLTGFNADLAFGTTGCIEYHVDVENSPALPFYLHIEQNGQTANHEPFQVNDFAGVVSRLRPNELTDWWALPTPISDKADAIGHDTVTSTNFTSDPSDPNGDFPGVGAKDASNNPFCTPFTITAKFPDHETYLTGLAGSGTVADEANYKTAVQTWGGGAGLRDNFGQFKSTNGFPNADEATAVYFNDADLKLGRDMHCRIASGGRIACYVSNYLDKATPPAGAAPALLAATAAHAGLATAGAPFATVAMEWDPNKGDETAVQFYVYNGLGDQVTSATLDGEGPKPVPQICLACHGGYYDSSDGLAHEARFLPFDIASFLTVDDVFNNAQTVSDLGLDAFTRLNQLGEFRALNALIKQAVSGPQGPNTEITELIDGWYAGCGGVNSGTCGTCVGPQCQDSFRKNFRPPLWEAQASLHSLYDNVVRVSCRGCHNTQPSFDWTDPDDFTLASFLKTAIERYVCTGQGLPNNQRRMPHAEVPFKTFWQTVLRPDLMEQAPMSFATCDRE